MRTYTATAEARLPCLTYGPRGEKWLGLLPKGTYYVQGVVYLADLKANGVLLRQDRTNKAYYLSAGGAADVGAL